MSTTIGNLPFDVDTPLVNNRGVIVGGVFDLTRSSYFVLKPGAKPAPIVTADPITAITAINDASQVLGTTQKALVGPSQAFLYSPRGGAVPIGTLPGYAESFPTALSAGGLVIGTNAKDVYYGPDPGTPFPDFTTAQGFLYGKHVGLIDLGGLPGLPFLDPAAINDTAGMVVGTASAPLGANPLDPPSTPVTHAFVYNVAQRKAKDLGTLPGFDSSAAGSVNSRGQVAGTLSNVANPEFAHVFFYSRSTGMRDAGNLPGFDQVRLVALQNDGGVVVQVTNSVTNVSHAAIYHVRSGLTDLGALPSPASVPVDQSFGFGPYLSAPNTQGKAIVTVNDGIGDSTIFLDDLKTRRITNISAQMGATQVVGNDSYIQLSDSNQLVVMTLDSNPTDSFIEQAVLVSIAPGSATHRPTGHAAIRPGSSPVGVMTTASRGRAA